MNEKENSTKTDKEYFKMYKDAVDFHRNKFDDYVELVAYYELEQDNIASLISKPWIYQINTPYATDAINMRVASLQANDYTGELEPLSPEDVEAVKQLNNVYHEKWNEMNMDKVVNDSILQASVIGEAYAHIVLDANKVHGGTSRKNKGMLSAYFIDAASVHIDPKALNMKRADYMCVSERVTKKEVITDYEGLDFDQLFSDNSPEDRGEIYVGNDYTTEQDKKVFNKITIYERKDGFIEKTVLIESKIVEETKSLQIRVFPIAQLRWQKKLKSPYGTSLMKMLLPLQKVVNEIESANANANMQYSSPSYVISEDSGINPQELAASAGAPAAVYVVSSGVDPKTAVVPLMQNRGIDEGLVRTKQELERAIYKLAGVSDEFKGDMGTVGNTSGGADLAMQRSKVIEQRVLVNIEEFVEDLTRIIVEFIVNGFAGEDIYSRGEKRANGSFEFKQFKIPENANELEYNFFIELNVRTQYSKEKQKQTLMELFNSERQYGESELKTLNMLDLLKVMNIPQTQDIVQRYERISALDAEQKAQAVTEIIMTAQTLGIDPQLANAAVSELILNKLETPMLDQFMQMAEQARAQQEQQAQVMQQAAQAQQLEQMQQQQDLELENTEFTPQNT